MRTKRLVPFLAIAAALSVPALGETAHAALRVYHGKDKAIANTQVYLYDNENDGNSVEAQYQRRASPGTTRHLWNHSGGGTRVSSGFGSSVIKLRVCEERDWAPDSCTSWVA
ncbi:hypothetical protein [Salinactinospora qingdaonensis]|uniref:Uncharacterized protein n=1 Tax=Salinactinospora qingdaonensis TaxID=702744 RepID=A0ABP7FY99_9ACTN